MRSRRRSRAGSRAWLTENEVKGTSDTNGLDHLGVARAKLRRVGLSHEQVGEVDEEDEDDEAAGNGPVNVLVVVPTAVGPPPPQIFTSYRPYVEGINVLLPHLPRNALVEKLHEAVTHTSFVLLSSPAGSGKTSLLTLFARRYPEIHCQSISFNQLAATASDLVGQFGVDVLGSECRLPPNDGLFVFMLDDAHCKYDDPSFWNLLIKGSSSWLPANVRFVISATHPLEAEVPESAVEFENLPRKLTRKDFLLRHDEARQLFDLENGLHREMRSPTVEEVIIQECNGHVGSLRIVIDAVATYFSTKVAQREQDLVAFCFSDRMLQELGRFFGRNHSMPSSPRLANFLIKCLVCGPDERGQIVKIKWDENEMRCLTTLMNAGIVITRGDYGDVTFSSPLAERYYSKWLFPNLLTQSTVGQDSFPKAAIFQHQFMQGLALHTHPSCMICPKLSRVFPASPGQRDQRVDDGEIAIILNEVFDGVLSCS